MVYIDRYNLYYGLRSAYQGKYKWLDLQALSESFLQDNVELIGIKYFTAITGSLSESKNRQKIYLKALTAHCCKLEIIYGRFLEKNRLPSTIISQRGTLNKPDQWNKYDRP